MSPFDVGSVVFAREASLDPDEAHSVYVDSTLGARRPIDDRETFAAMLHHANLIVTARHQGTLIGLARTLTDFAFVGYLADLAVIAERQRHGVGTGLIEETRRHMGPRSMIVLLAAPAAVDYYPRIGFRRHESAWILAASDPLARSPE